MNRYFWSLLTLLFLSSCGASKKIKQQERANNQVLVEKYTKYLGEEPSTEHLVVYKFIDAWWGVPHRLGGNSQKGVDCSGFVVQFYSQVYGKEVARTTQGLYADAKPVPLGKLKTGDLVFFELSSVGKITHVGIYLQNGRFVHASTSKGVRIDDMEDVYYRQKKKYGGRLP
ncbi:MAG: NlpC/P60 family protein [Sphingobacteriaceae bacterium]|nr:NlpC/P60 family protein [Sphingobacteriaceae bacterium]